ncbi:unnamed protein product [Microthlaspi erraticum]|uniref:F-box domain-containing protein n=1 Tax=Microthlaspi erraticum TaxID=1685480 RepID=A0A6D2LA42_9BRAS|nr:unnamed protein product [Microthlaspi erraticum]CAA7057900.1 unnamed protein product [Microthlaspi erraticum]
MLSNLPRDLEEDILSRVPLISLRRLQSTCKRWYHHALFRDQRFIKTLFDKTVRQYQAFTLMDFRVYSVSFDTNKGPSLVLTDKLRVIDPLSNSEVDISQAFHCDGILLCTTTDNRFVALNPFSRQTRWIEPRNHHMRSEIYALGYDNKELCHSYKILRFMGPHYQTVEIYEVRSNLWRNLDASPGGDLESLGVSLRGNTYWISKRRRVKGYLLLEFDFSTEIFQKMCIPVQKTEFNDAMVLSAVREERLYLLYQCAKTRKMEIWVTNEIDETTVASWSKFLTVDFKSGIHMLFSRASFLVEEEKKIAVCCYQERISGLFIVGQDKYEKFVFSCRVIKCMPIVFGYVPRLV